MNTTAQKVRRIVRDYVLITLAILIMGLGIYVFKFQNGFAFGGVSGFASVISQMTGISAATFTNVVNTGLLVLGFIFLGRAVGIRTVYATAVLAAELWALERWLPMNGPLTDEPLLELVFTVMLQAVSSAILFNISASSGGTDIIAMILRKYTSIPIGAALLLVDAAAVVLAFFAVDPRTGMFSLLGLLSKSVGIDTMIENLNRSKCFTIVCTDPEPILHYIMDTLNRGATVFDARGAFTGQPKTVILTDMKPTEAVRLRNYVRENRPEAFIQITNSSEIIGKGFLTS